MTNFPGSLTRSLMVSLGRERTRSRGEGLSFLRPLGAQDER